MRAAVVVASDRAAAGTYEDRSGPAAAAWFTARGWDVAPVVVVPDGEPVREALLALVAVHDDVSRGGLAGVPDVIVTSGGTGIAPSDRTPEMTRAVLDREVPGIAELVRARSLTPTDLSKKSVPGAALSRGVAGVVGRTLVVNLPGSVGGVLDGLDALTDVLGHAVDQLAGADHSHAVDSHTHASPQGEAVVLRADVVDAPLDGLIAELGDLVRDDACGAVATFTGYVRDHDGGRGVTDLHYEAHPDAARILAEVAVRVSSRIAAATGDRVRAAVVHRVGDLRIGDVAVVAAVASGHRQAAFTCASDLVEELKAEVPIWKQQGFTDGTSEWVASLG